MAVVLAYKYKPPKYARGHKVTDTIRRTPIWIKAAQIDAGDLVGDATTELFQLPDNTLVTDLMMQITEAFKGGTTLQRGDAGDTDRFIAADSFAAGGYSMKQGAQPGSGGHVYSALDTIDLKTVGTPTAGTVDVWAAVIFDADVLGLS